MVSTCSLTLFLPRGIEDPKEFNSLLTHALKNGVGFGRC